MTLEAKADHYSGGPATNVTGQAALQSMCLLVVLSLVLLSLGPMLDHHFAERHPEHQHLYLGSVIPDHGHSFEQDHIHDSSEMLRLLMQSTDDLRGDGIVALTSNDGTGIGAVDLTVPVSLQTIPSGGDDGTGVLRLAPDQYRALNSASVSPAKRPPRI